MDGGVPVERAVNMALLYISTRFSVNAVSFQRDAEKFYLPVALYAAKRENHIIREMLRTAPDHSICFVRDRLFAEYCFAFADHLVIFVGPFRTRRLYRSQLPEKPALTDDEKEQYLALFSAYPEIKTEDIRLYLHIFFTGLCGSTNQITESTLDMQSENLRHVWEEEFFFERENNREIAVQGNTAFLLMSNIQAGNYETSIRLYRRIMNNRGQSFILIHAIEGLTSIRILAQIAMKKAGVSDTSSGQLLTDFKLHARTVTDITESRRLAEELIYNCCRLVRENKTRDYSPAIKTAVDYIHFRLSEPLSVPAIAAEAGLTPNSLTTKFHREVGLTPTAYITKCRLENAARILKNTELSILEICTRVGILDANYFTRCFRKQYGCSPTEYRKRVGEPEEES